MRQKNKKKTRHDKKYKHTERKKKLVLRVFTEMSNIDINGQQFINCTFYDDVSRADN